MVKEAARFPEGCPRWMNEPFAQLVHHQNNLAAVVCLAEDGPRSFDWTTYTQRPGEAALAVFPTNMYNQSMFNSPSSYACVSVFNMLPTTIYKVNMSLRK
jgi:hypothetical protein